MKIYLVGGAVRDRLLGFEIRNRDRDWVVVGGTVNDMLKLGYRQVGKEFPVFIHPETGEEYALARLERKVKPGYTGFVFDTSPKVTLKEDLERRDLTINAMAEAKDGQLIDYYNGQQDLKSKILRHVSPAFAEDPVRILRVGRFLARYYHLGFHIAPETLQLMSKMVAIGEVDALVAERVWKELERALEEPNPEQFFVVLAECGALAKLFPHLDINGTGIKALIHATKMEINHSVLVRLAALLHSQPEDGSEIHAKASISSLCNRYRVPNAYRELALLTALHYKTAFKTKALTASELLQLFSALDIFRRWDRFQQFIYACTAIAQARDVDFDSSWLINCANAAKSYDVQELVVQNLDGKELASKLKEKRIEKIEEFVKSFL